MALIKRNYVDGETIITAQNLNDIQDEVISLGTNKVPITRTINSKALSSNITLSASDVSAVPTTRTVNSKALSSNITLTAGDIGYNSSTTYSASTIGAGLNYLQGEVTNVKGAITSVKNKDFDKITTSASYYVSGGLTEAGADSGTEGRIRTANYVVIDTRSVYVERSDNIRPQFCFYDSSYNMIGRTDWIQRNGKIAIPEGTSYVRWQIQDVGGSLSPSDHAVMDIYKCYTLVNSDNMMSTPIRAVCISDSIGYGVCGVYPDSKVVGQSWITALCASSGYELYNMSHRGMGYIVTGTGDTTSITDIITEINGLRRSYYNLWIIQLGLNDYLTENADITGITQKIRSLTSAIASNSPSARIVVLSPFNCAMYGDGSTNYCYLYSYGDRTLKDVCDTIESACESRGIEYINVAKNLINAYSLSANVFGDKVHPTQTMHYEIAKIIKRYL